MSKPPAAIFTLERDKYSETSSGKIDMTSTTKMAGIKNKFAADRSAHALNDRVLFFASSIQLLHHY